MLVSPERQRRIAECKVRAGAVNYIKLRNLIESMTISLSNWFIIYPQKEKEIIKSEFEKLNLKDFSVSIIIIKDNLSKKEEDEYVAFINKNLKYNGHINTSSETKLIDTIESMSGVKNDDLYILKNGRIIHKKLIF